MPALSLQLPGTVGTLNYTEESKEALAERYNIVGTRAYPKKFCFPPRLSSSPFTRRAHLARLQLDREEYSRLAREHQERIRRLEEGNPLEIDSSFQINFPRYAALSYQEIDEWASELPAVGRVITRNNKLSIFFHPALLHPLIGSEEGAVGRPSGPVCLTLGSGRDYHITTEYGHPHIGPSNHCLGNASEIALGLIGDNNIKEFIRHMISYRLGYNEADLLDSQWGHTAAQWWSEQAAIEREGLPPNSRRISEILIQDGRTGEVRPLGELIIGNRLDSIIERVSTTSTIPNLIEATCRLSILLLSQQREAVEFVERRCPHCGGESLAVSGRDVVSVCLECQQTPLRCTCRGVGRGRIGRHVQYLHYPDVSHVPCEGCGQEEYTDCYVWEDQGGDNVGFLTYETIGCEECMYRVYERDNRQHDDTSYSSTSTN